MEALMGVIEAVISQTSRISKGETRGKIRTWPVALFSFHELRDALWDAILPFSFLLENILCKIGKVELCVFIAICNFFFLFIIFVFFFLFLGLAVCPLYDSRESSTSWYYFFFFFELKVNDFCYQFGNFWYFSNTTTTTQANSKQCCCCRMSLTPILNGWLVDCFTYAITVVILLLLLFDLFMCVCMEIAYEIWHVACGSCVAWGDNTATHSAHKHTRIRANTHTPTYRDTRTIICIQTKQHVKQPYWCCSSSIAGWLVDLVAVARWPRLRETSLTWNSMSFF